MLLADAVDAADALFQPGRIPGQIEINDAVAKLQVNAFTAGVGRDQELVPGAEQFHLPHLFFAAERTVNDAARIAELAQEAFQRLLARPEFGKDEEL